MRAAKLASAVGTSALLLCALASASGAQRAPIIRVYSSNGAYTLATTSYVTPVIEVSENAYVFAVSMDVDGQIQVLQPDFPGISVRMLAHKRLNLPNFFTGFSRQSDRATYYSTSGYSGYDSYSDSYYNDGYLDSRGTVIALASRVPFNLDLIASGGDWDMATIRRLIDNRTPQMAAQSLANYLGVKGEPIGRDYLRYGGGRNYNSGYNYANGYSSCDVFGYSYAPTLASRYFQASNLIAQLRQRGQRATIAYDTCGFPFVVFQGSSGQYGGTRPPNPRGDTALIPRSRLPDRGKGRPRVPQSASRPVPEGVFPIPQRAELPQMGDVTIKAPKGRRSEPGQFLQGYRDQAGTMSAPGRVPIERVSTPRTDPTAATGAMPVRESRPEPRVSAPPPTRAPDPPRESAPAPVVRDRPSTPPPPPPRVETPTVTNRPPSRQ